MKGETLAPWGRTSNEKQRQELVLVERAYYGVRATDAIARKVDAARGRLCASFL